MTDHQLAKRVQEALRPGLLTQQQVAAMFGISKGRVFQLEQRAFIKIVRELRQDPLMKELAEEVSS